MSDKECQENELCALESIYNSEEIKVIEDNGRSGGQFYAFPDLTPGFKVIYRDLRNEGESVAEELEIGYLPPLVLYFSLPCDYPSQQPPIFTLSCKWLRKLQISSLCRKLDQIWEENKGMEILFLWTQFLKEDSLKFLGYEHCLDLSAMYTYHLDYVARRKAKSLQLANKKTSSVAKNVDSTSSLRCDVGNVTVYDNSVSDVGNPSFYTEKRPGGRARGYRSGNYSWRARRNWNNRNAHSSMAAPRIPSSEPEPVNGKKDDELYKSSVPVAPTAPKKKSSFPGDQRAVLDISPFTSVVSVLVDYNKAREVEVFKRNFHTCKICFQDKPGLQCTRFEPCGHVFCRECISSYFEVRIKEGTVHHIACPEDKCTSEASHVQVRELVTQELFAKYDSVLLNAMLDSMQDVIYCPRANCQYPTTREPDEKMATCPSCNYVFCVYCKMVYHGVEPCRFRSDERMRLVEEYQSGDDAKRTTLEQRYGRRQLQVLVDNTMSEAWINRNSKNCPNCNAAIEKSDGCNKMVCWRCNAFFCWICGARLNPQAPYSHFNSTTSKCFNKLFYGVTPEDEMDDDDDEEEEVGAYLDIAI